MRIALRRGNCNSDRVLQDKWRSAETATGVRDCGYGCAKGMGTGVLYGYRYGRMCECRN